MSISSLKMRPYYFVSILAIFLVVFSACSGGGTSGIEPTKPRPEILLQINGQFFPSEDPIPLFVCALNEMIVTGVTTDGKKPIKYSFTLVDKPALSNAGFMLTNDDYDAPVATPLVVDINAFDQGIVYFKADIPGTYVLSILATVDGTFNDYADYPLEVTLSTKENPCLLAFDDPGSDNMGYAADPPPGNPLGGIEGETVEIQGLNLDPLTPGFEIFVTDGTTDYALQSISVISLVYGLFTLEATMPAGCGHDDDLWVKNDDYPLPTAITENAQIKPDIYTYLPAITDIDPPNGSCQNIQPTTIYGGGFLETFNLNTLNVTINGVDAQNISFVGCGELAVTPPPFDGSGEPNDVEVLIVNPDGNISTSPSQSGYDPLFTYDPVITGITPQDGKANDIITIDGCAFASDVQVTIEQVGNPPGGTTALTQVFNLPDLDAPGEYFRVSDLVIQFRVPNGTQDAGQNRTVTATNPTSSSPDNSTTTTFDYLPDFTGMTPTNGIAGASIDIWGTGFDQDIDVRIVNGEPGITTVTSAFVDATHIQFAVPGGQYDYGHGRAVTVRDVSSGAEDGGFSLDYDPDCTNLSPTGGVAGVTITINGFGFYTDLTGTIEDAIGGTTDVSGTLNWVDANQVQFTVPGGPNDSGQGRTVTITDNYSGRSTTCLFNYDPDCASLSPSNGETGDTIDILGTGFDADLTVTIEDAISGTTDVTGTLNRVDANQVQFTVPGGPNDSGQGRTVTITDSSSSAVTTCLFDYDPGCANISPPIGRAGDTVDINGTGLDTDLTVTIEDAIGGTTDVTGTLNRVSANLVQFTVQCGIYDYGQNRTITITDNSSGASTTDCSFTYDPACTGLTPSSGDAGGGTSVTIDGCGFDTSASLSMPDLPSATFQQDCVLDDNGDYCWVDGTQIDLITPAGGGDQIIEIDNGYGTPSQDCIFDYSITCGSPSPASGAYGDEIVVSGSGFAPGQLQVFFGVDEIELTADAGGTFDPGEFRRDSLTQITVKLPCGGPNDYGAGMPIKIQKKNKPAQFCTVFITYEQSCSGIDVSEGACGATVQVTGCGFAPGVDVVFGNTSASSLTRNDANSLTATAPDGPDAAGDANGTVSVTVTGTTPTCSPGSFTYEASCASINPTVAAFGEITSIYGCGFATGVTVTFDGVPQSFTRVDSTELDVDVPGGATDYGTVSVAVANPTTAACDPGSFTFAPSITDVVPNEGPESGGLDVDVNGYGFQSLSSVVEFGSGNAGTVNSGDGNQLNVTIPSGTGTVDVIVTNPGPNSDTLASGFTYSTRPFITGITPTEGPEAGGTGVDVTGFQFHVGNITAKFGGVDALLTIASSATDLNAVTPPGPGLGTVNVTVENTDAPPGTSDPFDGFTYKDRNVSGGYTERSLDGGYNSVSITHDFAGSGDPSDDVFVTSVGSVFNPAFAPINGGATTFAGDGTYAVSAGADEFSVTNDGTPTASLANAAADSGTYVMNDDGTLTMDGHKTGSLAPDANALFVATTLSQADRANAMYIYAKEGSGSSSVSLTGKTMGFVAFVHEYEAAQASDAVYNFQGTVTFTGTNFTLTALNQIQNIYQNASVTTSTSTGDDTGGTYDAETNGLFRLTFEAADDASELDLFDSDEIVGIFTVTDNPAPEDAQLFAGANLSSTGANPGKSVLVIMVPLGAGKTAANFGGELADMGWAQGLFGHEFDVLSSDESTYTTSNAAVSYDDVLGDQTEVAVEKRVVTDSSQTPTSGPGLVNVYSVQSNGRYTASGPSPAIEGFISEDDSVNASVDTANTQTNNIRLELTK